MNENDQEVLEDGLGQKIENMQIFDVLYDDDIWDSEVPEAPQKNKYSVEDAYIVTINRYGKVNLSYMSLLCGKSEKDIIRRMEGKMIWRDPMRYDTEKPYENWLTREQYVRGNIYRLLEEAKEQNGKDGRKGLFGANIRLLTSELPDGPKSEELVVTLGATWVPEKYYLDFICDLLDMHRNKPTLYYDTYFNRWELKRGNDFLNIRNSGVYGTRRMTALQIIKKTMNASSLKVYDREYDYASGKEKSVFNRQETLAAQEKQQLITQEFKKWLRRKPRVVAHLQQIYTDKYGYQIPHYKGDFLLLPNMNPLVKLYDHQRSAVARIILSPNNVLLDHDVGAGKTYVMAAGIHERLRIGLSRKAMFVVPNAVLEPTVQAYRFLYPEDRPEVIYPSRFKHDMREQIIEEIKRANGGVFIIASSSFDFLDMSGSCRLDKMNEEIRRCSRAMNGCTDYSRLISLRTKYQRLNKEKEKFIEDHEDKCTDCFDLLGIDLLVVDECHNYKNITLDADSDAFPGRTSKGSRKADRMLAKCDHVREHGGKLVFATGTPLTNTMAELYVLQRYLQPEELELLHIIRFNDWATTFTTSHTEFEIDVTSASYRFVTRFDSFHNLPELMALFGNVCDFYKIDRDRMDLPESGDYQKIVVPKSDLQIAYIRQIVERADMIRHGAVRRKDDNYLKLTSDGRKCALDYRLVEPAGDTEGGEQQHNGSSVLREQPHAGNPAPGTEAKDKYGHSIAGQQGNGNCKASAAAAVIRRLYLEHPGTTQAVFCDMSTPSDTFNVYDELRRLLIEDGIPGNEIAFIHEGHTEKKREKLLTDFNAGRIRVLIGSTAKLGTGVNIQERLIAVHHLDAPWKPTDIVQRDGRAIRQGNRNPEVFRYVYVTANSFDAYTWQKLESKVRFITSFLSGTLDRTARCESDIGEMVLDYSEIKALAIGSPLIKERVKVNNEIMRARSAANRRREELLGYQKILSEYPDRCEEMKELIREAARDIRTSRRGRHSLGKKAREEMGAAILHALGQSAQFDEEQQVCTYNGFRVCVPAYMPQDKPHLLLRRGPRMSYRVEMDDVKLLGCCTRIDNVLRDLPAQKKQLEENLRKLDVMRADALDQISIGNPEEARIEKLTKELEKIDRRLKEEMENGGH